MAGDVFKIPHLGSILISRALRCLWGQFDSLVTHPHLNKPPWNSIHPTVTPSFQHVSWFHHDHAQSYIPKSYNVSTYGSSAHWVMSWTLVRVYSFLGFILSVSSLYYLSFFPPSSKKRRAPVLTNGARIIHWSYSGPVQDSFVICNYPVGKVITTMLCRSKPVAALLLNISSIS